MINVLPLQSLFIDLYKIKNMCIKLFYNLFYSITFFETEFKLYTQICFHIIYNEKLIYFSDTLGHT